jgi:hypothetical protein
MKRERSPIVVEEGKRGRIELNMNMFSIMQKT